MTTNQIAYWNLQETKRANLEKERQGRDTIGETARSNLAKETETNRSNVAKESETYRSNLAKETETKRSNLATEAEKKRSNLANETHQSNMLIETATHNRATEKETERHNVAVETETNRANLADEGLRALAQQLNEDKHKLEIERFGLEKEVAEFNNALTAAKTEREKQEAAKAMYDAILRKKDAVAIGVVKGDTWYESTILALDKILGGALGVFKGRF